jgi:beta-N-acetylhexosaminidase
VSRRTALGIGLAAGAAFADRRAIASQDAPSPSIPAMTDQELAARLFVVPIEGVALTADEDAWLRALKPGGVILTFQNFGAPADVRALVAAIHATNPDWPPLVAVDQEGGLVSRIADDPAPDAPTLGILPAAEISRLALLRAEALAGYGFDVNFAPLADVSYAPDSAMAGRTFGSDPALVAAAVTAYFDGVAGTGVLHCAKHFPGHGRVTVDSHVALPVLDVDPGLWWATDALPFRAAVAAGAPMIMLGHLLMPAWDDVPASVSGEAVRVLREDLGFAGGVVSDDLGMGALAGWSPLEVVDLAIAAGVDLLLYVVLTAPLADLIGHVVARIDANADARARVVSSVERLLRLRG